MKFNHFLLFEVLRLGRLQVRAIAKHTRAFRKKAKRAQSWYEGVHERLGFGAVIKQFNLKAVDADLVVGLNELRKGVLVGLQLEGDSAQEEPVQVTHQLLVFFQKLLHRVV